MPNCLIEPLFQSDLQDVVLLTFDWSNQVLFEEKRNG